jgi:RNA polymerase subunit RPABC4/transcription elongation factor Spt4
MFEDIIKEKSKKLKWDFDKYGKKAYCPVCGSEDLTTIREQLLSDRLEKDIRCNFCSTEWREEWKDFKQNGIDFTLKEVSICAFGVKHW